MHWHCHRKAAIGIKDSAISPACLCKNLALFNNIILTFLKNNLLKQSDQREGQQSGSAKKKEALASLFRGGKRDGWADLDFRWVLSTWRVSEIDVDSTLELATGQDQTGEAWEECGALLAKCSFQLGPSFLS